MAETFSDIGRYPVAIVSFLLIAAGLHVLSNKLGCYGIMRNLVFALSCAIIAAALCGAVVLLANHGQNPLVFGQIVVGFVVAVPVSLIHRSLFAQHPPDKP